MKELVNNSFKEIGIWASKIGIHPINALPITCDDIAKIDVKALSVISFIDFEDLINKISSYNIYIKSQKGSIEAQIEIIEKELNKALYLETNNLGDNYRYKNIDEKISIVRTINAEIDETFRKLSLLRAQFAKIKDLPFSIDKKIEILRSIYNRRLSNESRQ